MASFERGACPIGMGEPPQVVFFARGFVGVVGDGLRPTVSPLSGLFRTDGRAFVIMDAFDDTF